MKCNVKIHGLLILLSLCSIAVPLILPVSCGTDEGTLFITTYPVDGTVAVDGVMQGKTPVILTLPSGKHEVTFSGYSEQYSAPGTRVVMIKAGEQKVLSGEYRNCFIPRDLPGGFSPADSLRLFGTSEKPLKDGTIFDYIDGGGLVYLKYGLRETTHAVFHDERFNKITVDIFDMVTPENALAIINDEEVCPSGFEPCEAGKDCKAYHYEPDFLIYFIKSKYLVYVSSTNDSLKHVVNTIGTSIANNIQ